MYGQRYLYCLHPVWSSGHLQGVFRITQQVSHLLWSHNTEDQDLYHLGKSWTLAKISMLLSHYLYNIVF